VAEALARELGPAWRAGSRAEALAEDVVCCVTPGAVPVVTEADLRSGLHLNMLGADGPGKAEATVDAVAACELFCDEWAQASHGGELTAAVAAGRVRREDVTELGAVLAGDAPAAARTRPSRSSIRPGWPSRTSPSRPPRWRPTGPAASVRSGQAVARPTRQLQRRHHAGVVGRPQAWMRSCGWSPTTSVLTVRRRGRLRMWSMKLLSVETGLVSVSDCPDVAGKAG
jgi:hypothetical protein